MKHRQSLDTFLQLTTCALLAVALASCAAAPSKNDASTPTAAPTEAAEPVQGADSPEMEDKSLPDSTTTARAEIDRLVASIEGATLEGNNPTGGETDGGGGGAGGAMADQQACARVCDTSDAICASASRICAIASRHSAEAYFSERCDWSKKECNTAGFQCGECSKEAPMTAPPDE